MQRMSACCFLVSLVVSVVQVLINNRNGFEIFFQQKIVALFGNNIKLIHVLLKREIRCFSDFIYEWFLI